jgi:hypothetical protein
VVVECTTLVVKRPATIWVGVEKGERLGRRAGVKATMRNLNLTGEEGRSSGMGGLQMLVDDYRRMTCSRYFIKTKSYPDQLPYYGFVPS